MPNKIARNANTQDECRRNWQRLVEGAATITLREVAGSVPSGSINGTNATFTLTHAPIVGREAVYVNGQRMYRGGSDDYTISGSVITFITPPKTGDKILVDYSY